MNAIRLLTLLWFAMPFGFSAGAQESLPLADRVNEAKLIVVGMLQHPVTISRHQDSSKIQVERVLFGSAPTNQTLLVWYASDRVLTPGIASGTHQISPTNRYVCFLTYEQASRSSADTFQVRAIGKGNYAHNAFEPATEQTLKEVTTLIIERSKKK